MVDEQGVEDADRQRHRGALRGEGQGRQHPEGDRGQEGLRAPRPGGLCDRPRDETRTGVEAMGKRILQRRRGKGGLQLEGLPAGEDRARPLPADESRTRPGHDGKLTVKAILDEKGRSAPLAQIQYGDHGAISYIPAVSGIAVGNEVQHGPDAAVANGNILPLEEDPRRDANLEHRAARRATAESSSGRPEARPSSSQRERGGRS